MNQPETLRDLDIKGTYSSQTSDLVTEFYNPALGVATGYDRVTGFFSPKVFAAAARGFAHLVKNNGKIRLITSIEVTPDVLEALRRSEFLDDDLNEYTKWDVGEIQDELERNYLGVFSYLLSSGQLEIKVAFTEQQNGILHQKIGIITDAKKDSIAFSGSNNETVYGWQQNIEEFKVFKSWELYSYDWYQDDLEIFLSLWNNAMPGVKTLSLDEAVKNRIIKETKSEKDIDEVVQEIEWSERKIGLKNSQETQDRRELFDYQQKAIDFWFTNNCTGIFEMATGTGKTFTTIEAMRRFQKEKGYIQAVVVVPLASLVSQWHNELLETMEGCSIIATSNPEWRSRLRSLARLTYLADEKPSFIIVTTYNLFNRKDFKELLQGFDSKFLLVADEMHNLVTENGIRSAASEMYAHRLGLSATPNRLWRPKKSARVAEIFDDKRFVFSIEEAIERGFLVPFNYYPEVIELSRQEFTDYLELSRRIRKKMGPLGRDALEDLDDESLKNLLIRRARIKKEARAKIGRLEEILIGLKRKDELHHALIYVDNEEYLATVKQMLNRNNIITAKIVGDTPKIERERIVKDLEERYISAITAIKCLDEGIDIPSAQKAFILSNNTDPREYVQRLGRVLRVDRKGRSKKYADIYDFIVMPPAETYEDRIDYEIAKGLIRQESIRAKFFTEIAMNRSDADYELFIAASEHGFVLRPDELCYNNDEEEDL